MSNQNHHLPELILGVSQDPSTFEFQIHVLVDPAETPDPSPLTDDEEMQMQICFEDFQHDLRGFYDILEAMYVIKALRLYRDEFPTFADYVVRRRGWALLFPNQLLTTPTQVPLEPELSPNQMEMHLPVKGRELNEASNGASGHTQGT
jgi:hypothetical protein